MSSKPFRRFTATLALSISAVIGSMTTAAESSPATWSITPYLWASQTTVDVSFRDQDVGSGDISFKDLLDVMDAAFMGHVEGGAGHWSAFADLTYLKTSDTSSEGLLTVRSNNEQMFLDAAAVYWPGGYGSPLSLFGGLRLSAFDDRYRISAGDVQLADRKSKKDYYDALIGVRYRFDLAPKWAILTRADASFGDSEGTFLLQANLAWTVGSRELNRILVGYQYKEAEFKQGDLELDFTYHGPMAGFNFRF